MSARSWLVGKTSWSFFSQFQAILSMDRKHVKNHILLSILLGGPLAAIHPVWHRIQKMFQQLIGRIKWLTARIPWVHLSTASKSLADLDLRVRPMPLEPLSEGQPHIFCPHGFVQFLEANTLRNIPFEIWKSNIMTNNRKSKKMKIF